MNVRLKNYLNNSSYKNMMVLVNYLKECSFLFDVHKVLLFQEEGKNSSVN